ETNLGTTAKRQPDHRSGRLGMQTARSQSRRAKMPRPVEECCRPQSAPDGGLTEFPYLAWDVDQSRAMSYFRARAESVPCHCWYLLQERVSDPIVMRML